MENIYKPTKEDLQPLIEQVGDLVTWEQKFVKALADFLAKNPLRYRGYGPYWWLVKQALIEHGETQFGDHVDAQMVEALDYGERTSNLIAAFTYSEGMFDLGKMTDSYHMIDDDGEQREYIIADDEMEILHATNQL